MSETKIIKQQFQVSFNFDLIFTSNLFGLKNRTLLDVIPQDDDTISKAIVVLDEGVATCHPKLKKSIIEYFSLHSNVLQLSGDIFEIPGGEQVKNDEVHITNILDKINQFGIDRHSYVIAIGGGAVLDAAGYAAAIAHRGVRLIRIPTTILSQNDSGIGVKNGINYFGKKNFVGSFAAPFAVINDQTFLTTLDDRNWRSGISEAIKVALIKDLDFFEWIERNTRALVNRNMEVMNELIYRCAKLHMDHICTSGDPFEQGSSRPLDFGHWSAHKLEQVSGYQILHGECVAIGIALDSTYSYLKGNLNASEIERILNCFLDLGFDISFEQMNKNIISGLEEFREHLGGKLTIMILQKLGLGIEVHEIDQNLVLNAMDYIAHFNSQKISI